MTIKSFFTEVLDISSDISVDTTPPLVLLLAIPIPLIAIFISVFRDWDKKKQKRSKIASEVAQMITQLPKSTIYKVYDKNGNSIDNIFEAVRCALEKNDLNSVKHSRAKLIVSD